MLRRVALVRTDVSEELSSSVIRVKRIGELGTLAVTSNRRTHRRTVGFINRARLCVLVVRVPGYRYRVPGFDSWRYQVFREVMGLERGPLGRVRITGEVLEKKVMAQIYKTQSNLSGGSLR
jgi:hypothetical protein